MPRPKKDGQHMNVFVERSIYNALKDYSEEKGQTMTMALERILKQFFENEKKNDN